MTKNDSQAAEENNYASLILESVRRFPDDIAIVRPEEMNDEEVTRYEKVTYREFGDRVGSSALAGRGAGIRGPADEGEVQGGRLSRNRGGVD